MDDDLVAALKASQGGPTVNYVLYAEVASDKGANEYPLETVRLPFAGMDPVVAGDRLRSRAKETMRELGFDTHDIERAQIVLGLLPDNVTSVLDAFVEEMSAGGRDLVLLDFLTWEAAKAQLGLSPKIVGGADEEMTYKGLRLRRSSAN